MPDYKTMYLTLFNSVTDAIERLKQAQIKTEEIFIMSDNTNIQALNPNFKIGQYR